MPKKIKLKRAKYMIPPKLDNNPLWDTVVTSLMPMLSFTNGAKGIGERTYSVQVSKVPTFNYKTLIEFEEVKEGIGNTTSLLVDIELEDRTTYYWRVSVADEAGNHTDWVVSRFYVNTEYTIVPRFLKRLNPVSTKTSSSISALEAMNVMNLDTYWHSDFGSEGNQWLEFNFGSIQEISKVWLMTDPNSEKFNGWIIDYHWEQSNDGKSWKPIENSEVIKAKTGRIEQDFEELNTQYLRFVIKKWYGLAAKINDIRFYTPSVLESIKTPSKDYLLVVGNEQDGTTHSQLNEFIKTNYPKLDIVSIPFYDIYYDIVEELDRMPVAIILSSNNVNYGKVPFFEYNGILDVIRNTDIPLLGIGAGFHLQYLSYCPTYARRIGYKKLNCIELAEHRKRAKIFIRQKESPLFIDVINKFTAVETNFWEVVDVLSEIIEYETLADLDYPLVVKNRLKEMYGVQFIPEIAAPYNQASNVLLNFIKLALDE